MFELRCFSYSILCIALSHCTSPSPKTNEQKLPKSQASYYKTHRAKNTYNDIDVAILSRELNLNQPIEDIGYRERSFDTCAVEANRSENPHCQRLFLGRVNFQIMCRESTGTVEKVKLTPFYSNKLKWKSNRTRGFTQTNHKGYGQAYFVNKTPNTRGHLYLYLGNRVARKRFHDQWKLILPKSWCLNQ